MPPPFTTATATFNFPEGSMTIAIYRRRPAHASTSPFATRLRLDDMLPITLSSTTWATPSECWAALP
ncbi:hypothetical protein KCP70_08350 [Salmonella enterica subsp. enterica]|nr:hypothetical protein KCP70_08350 [Salmonella enterica subsp. enterica]